MKKLTAGIFASILGLTAIGAADAAVPSTKYVDDAVAAAQLDIADTYATKTALETEESARAQADLTLQGNIDDVAADVLLKQDQLKDTMIVKQGTGNVVSGITASDGVITYTTAAVATSEGLAKLQEDVSAAEGDIANIKAEQTTQNNAIQGLQSAGYITNADLTGYATKADAQGYANAKDTAISAAQTAANEAKDAAAANATAIEGKLSADAAAATYELKANVSGAQDNAENGKYVLTKIVTQGEGGVEVVSYGWELIDREYSAQ